MDNFPSLYTTEVLKDSSSDTSGERETDILGPNSDDLLAPTSELRDFVKTPFKLTREGRQRVQSLRPSNRRGVRLDQNPETPVSTATTQAQSNTPAQPQKKGPLSKLFA